MIFPATSTIVFAIVPITFPVPSTILPAAVTTPVASLPTIFPAVPMILPARSTTPVTTCPVAVTTPVTTLVVAPTTPVTTFEAVFAIDTIASKIPGCGAADAYIIFYVIIMKC